MNYAEIFSVSIVTGAGLMLGALFLLVLILTVVSSLAWAYCSIKGINPENADPHDRRGET